MKKRVQEQDLQAQELLNSLQKKLRNFAEAQRVEQEKDIARLEQRLQSLEELHQQQNLETQGAAQCSLDCAAATGLAVSSMLEVSNESLKTLSAKAAASARSVKEQTCEAAQKAAVEREKHALEMLAVLQSLKVRAWPFCHVAQSNAPGPQI